MQVGLKSVRNDCQTNKIPHSELPDDHMARHILWT